MNFKSLTLGTLATISTILGVVPSAEAYQVRYDCGQVRGFQLCVSYQDPNNDDILYIDGPAGRETMTISCYADGSFNWKSFGSNSQSFGQYIAEGFCND